MDFINNLLGNLEYTVLIRVLAAALLGFAIGLEREITNKYAGLRTNILVCLGACVFTILSIYAFPTVLTGEHANGLRDTARVAAQVVTDGGSLAGGRLPRGHALWQRRNGLWAHNRRNTLDGGKYRDGVRGRHVRVGNLCNRFVHTRSCVRQIF